MTDRSGATPPERPPARSWLWQRPKTNTPPQGFSWPTISFLLTLLVAYGAVAGAVALILLLANRGLIREDFVLPILLVAAVLGLLGSLAGLVPMFHRAALTTPTEALGLPAGSVRALIAVSFIIMFLITSVFLQARMGTSSVADLEGVSPDEFARIQEDADLVILSATVESTGADGPIRTVQVGVRPTEDEADFADRMFSTISTIVVALTAFYFGNRAVTTARDVVGGGASLTLVTPTEDETYLPAEGEAMTVRLVAHPPGTEVTGEATAGELVRMEGQPGTFRYTAPPETTEAVLSFHLPGFPQANRVSLTLTGRAPVEEDQPPEQPDEDEQPWLPPPEDSGDWDDVEADWVNRLSEADEADPT